MPYEPDKTMYPNSASFRLSKDLIHYPSLNHNTYLLMKGYNGIKIIGKVSNAVVYIVWNMLRQYKTELWTDYLDKIDDILIFPFAENDGTITFEGQGLNGDEWNATVKCELINLTQAEISQLTTSESS